MYDCTGSIPLVFYPAVPYGNLSTNGYPDCQGINTAYSSANSNPYFWGWTPLFNLANAIFGAVSSSGLSLAEFDLINEINLDQFRSVLTGPPGQLVIVEVSTDLLNWLPIWTNTFAGPLNFSDLQSGVSKRFYRAHLP